MHTIQAFLHAMHCKYLYWWNIIHRPYERKNPKSPIAIMFVCRLYFYPDFAWPLASVAAERLKIVRTLLAEKLRQNGFSGSARAHISTSQNNKTKSKKERNRSRTLPTSCLPSVCNILILLQAPIVGCYCCCCTIINVLVSTLLCVLLLSSDW